MNILKWIQKRIFPTREYYIGGAGFKQRSLIEPYDNMDF